jgi:hypothetical protein
LGGAAALAAGFDAAGFFSSAAERLTQATRSDTAIAGPIKPARDLFVVMIIP